VVVKAAYIHPDSAINCHFGQRYPNAPITNIVHCFNSVLLDDLRHERNRPHRLRKIECWESASFTSPNFPGPPTSGHGHIPLWLLAKQYQR
tara:strand:- start:42 stop:314 length:273 start_codon:yes stop_codon:yes gene_type:complete